MTLDPFDDLLDRLDGVRLRGRDAADARCPAHDDRRASLSIARGRDGRTLIQCHAGCRWDSVLDAVGLDRGAAFGEPRMVAEYTYTDEEGAPLFVVERWEPKSFRQRMANGKRKAPSDSVRVLYNLPTIKAVRGAAVTSLYYVEGEKDCGTLGDLGYAATTSLGGANKPWLAQYSEELAGLHVVIIADNDAPGRKWARTVSDNLAGHATTTIMVPPPGIKDVTALIEAGYTVGDLVALPDTHGEVGWASEYPVVQVSWLWPGRLPQGMLTMLEGDPGTGKSTIIAELVACLTTGRALPGSSVHLSPRTVAMLADEDSWNSVVAPRLSVAGADLRRVAHLRGIRQGDYLSPYSLGDLAVLRHDLGKIRADLLIIDPIMAYLGDNNVDSYKDQHVRSVLGPLVQMAEEDDTTIVALRHFTKGSLGGKALYRGGGSIGFTGQARAVLQTAEHPEGDGYVLAVAKCNLAPLAATLGYHITVDERMQVGRIKWEPNPLPWSAQELQSGPPDGRGGERSQATDARDWLVRYLADDQPATWKDITRDGKEAGHAEHTLRNVRPQVAEPVPGVNGRRSVRWRGIARSPLATITHLAEWQANGQMEAVERQMDFTADAIQDRLEAAATEPVVDQPPEVANGESTRQMDPAPIEPAEAPEVPCATPQGPSAHLPANFANREDGQMGTLTCDVCGTPEGLVTYDSDTIRCGLHSPLIWDPQ